MAKEIGTEQLQVTREERTWRVEIFCEKGNDPVVRAHREVVTTGPDGAIIQTVRNEKIAQRTLSQIKDQQYVIGEFKLTGAQLAGIISAIADDLAQEDDDNAAKLAAEKAAEAAKLEAK